MKGKLFLIPGFISETNASHAFPSVNAELIKDIRNFIVEDIRTARRMLRKTIPDFDINSSIFFEIDKHTTNWDATEYLQPALKGEAMGLLSEAGVPCVADPGSVFVKKAHELGIRVIPLIGPSSILMGLMASGLNGQNFAFNGYIDIKPEQRMAKIKKLEERAYKEHQTQLFIETPYRNMQLVDCILKTCKPETLLMIAADITAASEYIKTKTINEWKKSGIPDLNKKTTIFAIGI